MDIYRRSYAIYTSGDAASIDDFVSRQAGTMIVGTDPTEWLEGAEQIAAVLRTYAPLLAHAGSTITPDAARAYGEGSAGWVIDTPTFTRQDQDYPCRATTILHQEEGAWKIAHQHFSFGVPSEAVEIFKDVVGAPAP